MKRTFKPSTFALTIASLLVLGACSTTGDDATMSDDMVMTEREGITTGPGGLAGPDGLYAQDLGGAAPGSQDDLVVNVGDRLFFGYDRYDLSTEARLTLDRQAQWLQRYPTLTFTIEGHADERGTREYNLALGERRANSVKNYMVALGVDPYRINTISYGKERPAVPGSNDSAWSQNRRAVTTLN